MTCPQLEEVLSRYRDLAPPGWREELWTPGEIPLLPNDAVRLADEIGGLGIPIMGVTDWSYTDSQEVTLFERPGGFYVGDETLSGEDAATRSLVLVREYITKSLHPLVHRVALNLDLRDCENVDCITKK
jgi:hypothetical protein